MPLNIAEALNEKQSTKIIEFESSYTIYINYIL